MSETKEITRPIIIEKDSDGEKDIVELTELLGKVPVTERKQLEIQIAKTKRGIIGEQNIIFELKNCSIPMVCIHNLYLKLDDVAVQIDFVLVTRNRVYVVESKNLYGDIEITERGDFYRMIDGKSTRFYSPFTQCEHHLELMRRLREKVSEAEFPRYFTEKHYEKNYQPLIVITNPNCSLHTEKAPKEITDNMVHSDQLARYITNKDAKSKYITQNSMENFAKFYEHMHRENPRDYLNRFRELAKTTRTPSPQPTVVREHDPIEQHAPITKNVPPVKSFNRSSTTPSCPWCGKILLVKAASQGQYAGVNFYACSGYPQCKYRDFSKATVASLN